MPSLVLNVRWPQRQVQAIPVSAETLDFEAYTLGGTEVKLRQSVARPATGDMSQIVLSPLPHGDVVVAVAAKDSSGAVVAAGGAHFKLLPNARTAGRISLASSEVSSVSGFFPEAAFPGSRLAVFGSGFGAGTDATPSVKLGGLAIASAQVTRVHPGLVYVDVPLEAGNGAVTVSSAVSSTSFSTVRSVTIDALPAEVFMRARVPLTITARDVNGALLGDVEADDLPWTVTSEQCLDCGDYPIEEEEEEEEEEEGEVELGGQPLSAIVDGVLVAGEHAERIRLRVGTDRLYAEAVVTAREIKPADLPVGMRTRVGVNLPADNPQNAAKIALGQKLFFENQLSSSGQMSCATCHDPSRDWTDGRKTPLGSDGQPLERNSPTILNAAHNATQFWDGRAVSLEAQAIAVFENARELDTNFEAFLAFVQASEDYKDRFTAAFGQVPATAAEAKDLAAKAIASFERTQVTGDSAFDRWLAGDAMALGRPAKLGLGIFFGTGQCNVCHSGSNFTDGAFHNDGIPGSGTQDMGRQKVSGSLAHNGAFKTPGLRNVANTAPYFHDGSRSTLMEAIRHYEDVDSHFPNLSPNIVPRALNGLQDRLFIQAFLRSLNGATPSVSLNP